MCVFFPPHKARNAAGSAFSVIFPFATYGNRIHGNRTAKIDCVVLTHLAESKLHFSAKDELINSVGFKGKLKCEFKMPPYQRTVLARWQTHYGAVAEDLHLQGVVGLPKYATNQLV